MDRELAIELLRELSFTATESYRQALETAINALSADVRQTRTSEDCISRQAVYNIIEREQFKGDAIAEIEKLPSVQPTKKGEWIYHKGDFGYYSCSECHKTRSSLLSGKFKFCPNCGADMRGET